MVQYIFKSDVIYATRSNNIKKSSNTSILARISEAWMITPEIQQENHTRLLFCSAFESGYSTTDIALEIRHFRFQSTPPFECGKTKTWCPIYLKVMKSIHMLKKQYLAGNIDDIKYSKIK